MTAVYCGRRSRFAFSRRLYSESTLCGTLLGIACTVLLHFVVVTRASAEDPTLREIIVTADRISSPKREVASSVTVVSGTEIEERQMQSAVEALKGVPGIDVVESGGAGGNVSIFIRGANSEHTLVLIDGVEANDPINPTRAFNGSTLTLDNIESIEIIRGPQSALYGSDAMGGVIKITTKRGEGRPAGFVSVEGGSYESFLERAGISGSEGSVDYSLAASRRDTSGVSAAGSKYGNSEHDGFSNTGFSSRFGIRPSRDFGADLFLRASRSLSELDNFGGVGGDDPNRELDNRQLFSRLVGNASLLDGRWKQSVGVGYSNQGIEDNNQVDTLSPVDFFFSTYQGSALKFDSQSDVTLSDSVLMVLGIETKQERGSSSYVSESSFGPYIDIFDDQTARTNSYFGQVKWSPSDTAHFTSGLRVDSNPKFGSEVTWKAGPVVHLGDTKLSASVGTGYKAPSLFQLYSSFGNEALTPEESFGWEVGVEHRFLDGRATLGGAVFGTQFEELITFDPVTFRSENISEASTQGFELYGEGDLSERVSLTISYSYTDATDDSTDATLLRRARHKVAALTQVKLSERSRFTGSLSYTGKRVDNDFSSFPVSRATLGGYPLLEFTTEYDLGSDVVLFARAENVLDREYEDVLGYGAPGGSAFGGVKVRF